MNSTIPTRSRAAHCYYCPCGKRSGWRVFTVKKHKNYWAVFAGKELILGVDADGGRKKMLAFADKLERMTAEEFHAE